MEPGEEVYGVIVPVRSFVGVTGHSGAASGGVVGVTFEFVCDHDGPLDRDCGYGYLREVWWFIQCWWSCVIIRFFWGVILKMCFGVVFLLLLWELFLVFW